MSEKTDIKKQDPVLLTAIQAFKKDTLKEVTHVKETHRDEMLLQIQSFKKSALSGGKMKSFTDVKDDIQHFDKTKLKKVGTKDTQGLLSEITSFKFEELHKVKKGPKSRTGLLTEIRDFQKDNLVKRGSLLEQIREFEKGGLKETEVQEGEGKKRAEERKKLLLDIKKFEKDTLQKKEELLKKIEESEKE